MIAGRVVLYQALVVTLEQRQLCTLAVYIIHVDCLNTT